MLQVYLREALIIVAMISGIPLAVSACVGLIVSLLQAATQIQEQSIGYCAKCISVGAVLVLASNFFCIKLLDFFQSVVGSIAALGHMP